jgi:hypothetical protein
MTLSLPPPHLTTFVSLAAKMEKIKKKKGKQLFSAGQRSITICKTTSYKIEKIGKIQTYFKWEYGKEEGCADVPIRCWGG